MTIKQLKKLIRGLPPEMEVMVLDGEFCFPACSGDSDLIEVNFDGITETCLLIAPCHHEENTEAKEIEKIKMN